MSWHVVPDDDLVHHEATAACACGPQFQVVDDVDLYVHQPLDDRDEEEEGTKNR